MLIFVAALVMGVIFGVIATVVVWLAKGEFNLGTGIVGGGAFLAGFLVSLMQFWYTMPTWGSIVLIGLLIAGIGTIALLRLFSRSFGRLGRSPEKIAALAIGALILIGPIYFGLSSAIWRGYDQAKYFDSILEFPDEKLPFNNIIEGENLRVVDSDLAAEIIQKSSPFGSNSMILELHVGKIYGELMWIGVIGTDSIRVGTDNAERKRNTIFGFAGVDLTDPTKEIVVVEQSFTIGHYLARQKTLNRIIWKLNPNYRAGDNSYFSMNDDDEMRLLVPYSVSKSWRVEKTYDIAMATYLEKLGGVLEFDSEGNLIEDYKDLTTLPDYARIQCYPEDWLEFNINKWGRHRKGDHEFAYFFTTSEQLGISWYDDVRVIYDANEGETSQYIMLTQAESESQLLRGAIKANASGIFFFDWADLQPKPIDTLNAIKHCTTAIDIEWGTTEHNFYPILPLLFPIRDTYRNMTDYAYVVPVQLSNIRFGGICITNPFDPSGVQTVIEFAEEFDTIDDVLNEALNSYFLMLGAETPTVDNKTETLDIYNFTSFEKDGDTIYVAYGNLTHYPYGNSTPFSENTTVWFTQDYLNVTQWQIV
ncbi:MAG: hypothetical protein ACTSPC_08845, partial [Candidatus Heimdallarchaeota archaeon]